MFRLRFFSPFQGNTKLLYKNIKSFASENKPQETIKEQAKKPEESIKQTLNKAEESTKDAIQKSEKETRVGQTYKYNANQFEQINSESFLKKMEKIEQQSRFNRTKPADSVKFPIMLALASAFLYHCWLTIPYNVVYKHATINEYINQRHYYHAIFLGSLSFQNFGHFVTYFPLMIYSFVLCSRFLKQKHMALVFLSNSLLTAAATYYFEKSDNKIVNLLTPKANGAVTPLCFMTIFLALRPDHMIFGSRMLPYFIIPATFYMYEFKEYSQHINEISREAHFTAIAYGLVCGLFFRYLLAKGKL